MDPADGLGDFVGALIWDKLDWLGLFSLGNIRLILVLYNKYCHKINVFSHRPLNLELHVPTFKYSNC